ncbi:MAG: DUF6132 family protein [Ignavibacteriales bacterium]|nr:DUF6132 family protein [Ignavibacteriales bacterium]
MFLNDKIKYFAKRFLPILGGASLGFAYYYFIGCKSGSCPIKSNPYYSTFYGAAVGLIFALPGKKKNDTDGNNSNK